jgi:hypothetical protein
MLTTLRCCALLGFLALVTGCGDSGPKTYAVSGAVTFAGEPVGEGEIVFRSAAGSEASCAGRIADGRFSFRATPGKKRVEIVASREVKSAPAESGETLNLQMYIPEKYNSKSELSADVTPDGPNSFDFRLEP